MNKLYCSYESEAKQVFLSCPFCKSDQLTIPSQKIDLENEGLPTIICSDCKECFTFKPLNAFTGQTFLEQKCGRILLNQTYVTDTPITCIFCGHDMYEGSIDYSSASTTKETEFVRLILNCPNCHQKFGLDLKKANQIIIKEIDE